MEMKYVRYDILSSMIFRRVFAITQDPLDGGATPNLTDPNPTAALNPTAPPQTATTAGIEFHIDVY